ncbi:MAG: hypothetical protein ACRDSP_24525 [Pseudonocardiaceae bacterium]
MPARVDRAHVRYLQAALTRLRIQDDTVGGGAVLPQALRYFAHARRMLDESDYSATIGRELLLVTADLGIECAWFAHDTDNPPLAHQLYRDAALLADSAGDSTQCVQLYANMAQQSSYLARYTGRPGYAREALRFADRAADIARHEPSPAVHAFVSLRHAIAHAQVGDEVAFRSAITTAAASWTVARTTPTRTGPGPSVSRRSPNSRRPAGRISVRSLRPSGSARPPLTTSPKPPATRPITGRLSRASSCGPETSSRRSTTA